MKMSLRQYCIEHGRDTLLREWDAARNGGLTPSDVSFGSHQKVWWRCSQGHSYRSEVRIRTRGTGCPICAGHTVLPEENSLAAKFPDLLSEWDTKRILRCCRRRSAGSTTGRSGGGVRKDIAGRRALPAASHQTQAVRSARDKRSCPDSMISLRCIRSLLNSGIGKRTVR